MSTRGVIARTTGEEGAFKGVYTHSDSYPTWAGKYLWALLHQQYQGNLKAMLHDLIDQHSGGWSELPTLGEPGRCFCHDKNSADDGDMIFTQEDTNAPDTDIEWVYAFDEETNRLYVIDIRNRTDAAIVELDGLEPDWSVIECGAELERCSHYAWVHFPELRKTASGELSTAVWLGTKDFSDRDACAYLIKGKRYTKGGSGYNGAYAFKDNPRFSKDVWVQAVKARNGKEHYEPVSKITDEGHVPYPGVTWVFPPTKDNSAETFKGDGQ